METSVEIQRADVAPIDPADEGHPKRWQILAVLASVAFMAQLDLFIVNIAIPAMSRSFGNAGLGNLSWVLNAYAIVFAALLVPAGRLADHFGRRRFLLVGVSVFTVSSVICALAPDLAVLIAGRVLQAVGAAAILPTSLGLLLPSFAVRQHGLVVGIWAGVAAVAASSGPPIGGLLVGLDWRWIFLVNVPIGIATVIAGRAILPEIRAEHGARLPEVSSVVAVLLGTALMTFATVQGSSWGWGSTRELAVYFVAAVSIAVAVWRSWVSPRAVIERALFKSAQFTTATLALFAFFVAFASWLIVTVLFLQDAWGYSAVRAGVAIAPGPLTAAVFAVNSSRIVAIFGRRTTAIAGAMFVVAASIFWLVAAPQTSSYGSGFLPGLFLGGAGAGLSQAPLFAAAGTLPPERATTGGAVLNMSRQVGSALGVAITVVLLSAARPTELAEFHRAWWFIAAAATGAAVIAGLGGSRRALRRGVIEAGSVG